MSTNVNTTNNQYRGGSTKGTGIKSAKARTSKNHHSKKWMVKVSSKKDLSTVGELKLSRNSGILDQCKLISNLRAMVEAKEPIPTFRGKDAPTSLTIPHSGYQLTDTKESLSLRNTMRTIFGDRHYEFRLSTALNMSSSGAGIVNSTISNSVLTSQTDFIALSGVFNEFFVKGFHLKWIPNSRYQYPLGGSSTISVANLPMGKADLQHGQAAYTSLGAMTDNFRFGYHSTGDPFTDSWINTESITTDTVVTSLTAPTQSWCTVNNSSNYQGTLQFLTQSSPPALPFSQVLGTFAVHWDVVFRVRA